MCNNDDGEGDDVLMMMGDASVNGGGDICGDDITIDDDDAVGDDDDGSGDDNDTDVIGC